VKNIETKVEGQILTIKVDLSKNFGISKSGKSIVIASTEGNTEIAPGSPIKFGLNIYTSKK
jgi:hypothetical protein